MDSKEVEKVQNWIKGLIDDPLGKNLLENSHFTQKQLETILIDILADQLLDKKVSQKEKSMMRRENKVTRGAFSRTLQQAKANMMKSLLTVLLLGYVGILETPSLSPFLEASNKLENYMREFSIIKNKDEKGLNYKNTVNSIHILKNNLRKTIYELMRQ